MLTYQRSRFWSRQSCSQSVDPDEGACAVLPFADHEQLWLTYNALHENPEFTALFLRGVQSFHDLDAVSKLRFSAFQNRFFKNFEGMYYSRQEGILTTDLWSEIERTMSDFLAYDGVRQWWETRKHWHTEPFVGVVDAMIAKGGKPTAYSTYDLKQVVLPKDS
jgi:hypothetical protein